MSVEMGIGYVLVEIGICKLKGGYIRRNMRKFVGNMEICQEKWGNVRRNVDMSGLRGICQVKYS
jgi:hypothetical protein